MFCYQCEQTWRGGDTAGCSTRGVCGKDGTTSDLQDLLVHAAKGVAQYDRLARKLGSVDAEAAAFAGFALFTTMTNVNFNPTRFASLLQEAAGVRDRVRERYESAARAAGLEPETPSGPAAWQPAADLDGLLLQAARTGITEGLDIVGPDVVGLRAFVLYAAKGTCAYYHHARELGVSDTEVDAEIVEVLAFLAERPTSTDELVEATLRVGRLNVRVMELLELANTGRFGRQEPASVRLSPVPGHAVLVSGHDLADLSAVLEQTAGTGVNVYTHGELLPAHAYPELRRHPHLAGNFGGAWQDQHADFSAFPGAILMTSNCLVEPQPAYRRRIFTTGPTGWPGVRHLDRADLGPLVEAARALPGFPDADDGDEETEGRTVTVGFGRHAVLGIADRVLDAVKAGQISHFFVIGGCDGAAPGRNYFTEVAERVPHDAVVLTMGCAKYRFNDQEFGDIGGIPRLLDVGQCNDSYGAVMIAQALADGLGVEVGDLPLSLIVSWFEQKAVAVLCSLLALGLRGMTLGPTLPAFITPAVLDVLVERFDVRATGDADADVAAAVAPR